MKITSFLFENSIIDNLRRQQETSSLVIFCALLSIIGSHIDQVVVDSVEKVEIRSKASKFISRAFLLENRWKRDFFWGRFEL